MVLASWKAIVVLAIATGYLSGPIFIEVFSGCAAVFIGLDSILGRRDCCSRANNKKGLLTNPKRLFLIKGLYFISAATGALMCTGIFGWGWEWAAPAMIGLGCLFGVKAVDLFR